MKLVRQIVAGVEEGGSLGFGKILGTRSESVPYCFVGRPLEVGEDSSGVEDDTPTARHVVDGEDVVRDGAEEIAADADAGEGEIIEGRKKGVSCHGREEGISGNGSRPEFERAG